VSDLVEPAREDVTSPLSTVPPVPPVTVALGDGTGRRRRPSGERPPLPRDLSRSGRWWAWATVGVLIVWFVYVVTEMRTIDRIDLAVLQWIVDRRWDPLTDLAVNLQTAGGERAILLVRWMALVPALWYHRFRHALVFVGCILVSTWLTANLSYGFGRPRPVGIPILGEWQGFSHPSAAMVDVAVALLGFTYLLVPRGRWRGYAKIATAVALGVLAFDRLYLGLNHPSDLIVGTILGVSLPLIAFRMLVPHEVFPVTYTKAKGAHLDVGGRRQEALKRALEEQLGLDVIDVRPFGLDGSSGSTPLRIRLADGTAYFGKLYASTHLRADRSYKLMRTLLYGRLEDESTFSTVRRLVQYEDYLLRLFTEAGLPVPKPHGFVEITPEREYLLVTEFFEGAAEIGDPEVVVDEAVIDDALAQVRAMWQAGLAHRDVKPANVLVRDGRVLLIDVAFAEVRPSPWRQAVDLANMMLCLALRTDPETVYARALCQYSPDEIAEAFAATRGLTLTSQLRTRLRQDGRDLIGQFRALAPQRPPIRIQRWSVRRIGLTISVVLLAVLSLIVTIGAFQGAKLL
jgi:tRNA A-37 threonylcarbamoyl transferase component Bud32/membrane-associated phospholipid phosphatase